VNVSFEPAFIEDLARELVALSSNNAKTVTAGITTEDRTYTLTIDPRELHLLSRAHQLYVSTYSTLDMSSRLPQDLSYYAEAWYNDQRYGVRFERGDLEGIFLTIDKVMAGADAPTLEGQLDIAPWQTHESGLDQPYFVGLP
jgi:hypothetical protein